MMLCKKVLRRFWYAFEFMIAIPIAILLLIVFPCYSVKFIKLFTDRIGHYALNTELMLCTLERFSACKRTKYVFYTCSPGSPICNQQLHKMWKRQILILPWADLAYKIDKILSVFLGKFYDSDGIKSRFESTLGVNDFSGLLESNNTPYLSFTNEEITYGKTCLKTLGIPENARIICLLVRDDNYLKQHLPGMDFSYHAFRNADIDNYKKAALYLAEKGYYVFRMGKYVNKPLQVDHPRVIDYATSSAQSDFMDIYLSSCCCFFISTVTGLDCVPQVFRKKIVFTNVVLPSELLTWYPNWLFIPKKIVSESNQCLTFQEIYKGIFQQWHKFPMADIFRHAGLEVMENTPDEILDVVKEAEARYAGTWVETDEMKDSQKQFWCQFPSDFKDLQGKPAFAEKIKIMIGSAFLMEHDALLKG